MKIQQILQRAQALVERVTTPDYPTSARDLAEANELVNLYIDELERLANTATVPPYLTGEQVADDILRRWYP